ncbi:molybdenum cofactor sulfurase [Cinnamomum micranthum f. kanehirae]|uniref:Molybdenum cofactor sulfurase n=1 Tax=Cinnamomum micranthum f. kanehirae TaxID=337451 RepID=A0A443PCV3_9MAGN|nr:molybdenum cofactor sulfurase [Cinnamomum micranthum f. kanehirae]
MVTSGRKIGPSGWSGIRSKGQWLVLVDAAKGCATQPPDLSKYPADFVVVSFYKIFGYPTGLGALIVRTEAAELLRRTYFSGGTVAASIADIDFVQRRRGIEESFEDGSQSFLSIAAINHGFKIVNTLKITAIARPFEIRGANLFESPFKALVLMLALIPWWSRSVLDFHVIHELSLEL